MNKASQIARTIQGLIPRSAVVILICLTGVISLFIIKKLQNPPASGIADFMTLYMGAELAGTHDLYNEQAGWTAQDNLLGNHSQAVFYLRPPFYALFLKPLLLMSYQHALRVWYGLIAVSLIAFVWIFPVTRSTTLCAACWSDGVSANFAMGQDSALLLVPIAICMRLYAAGQTYVAGLVLSACLIKFHFLVFLPLLILIQKTWRFAAGLATGTLLLIGLSFAAQGPHWPIDYLRALMRPSDQPFRALSFNIRGALLSSPHAVQMHVAASVVVALITAAVCKRVDFNLALACCLLAALLVSWHVYDQDYVLALPLSCLLLTSSRQIVPFAVVFSCGFLYLSVPAVVVMALFLLTLVAVEGPKLRTLHRDVWGAA